MVWLVKSLIFTFISPKKLNQLIIKTAYWSWSKAKEFNLENERFIQEALYWFQQIIFVCKIKAALYPFLMGYKIINVAFTFNLFSYFLKKIKHSKIHITTNETHYQIHISFILFSSVSRFVSTKFIN